MPQWKRTVAGPDPITHPPNLDDGHQGRNMNHDEAAQAVDAGRVTEAILKPADDANGWIILLAQADGDQRLFTDSGGTEKVYHDLDQATAAARELGLTQIRVEERF
jgi:hypothetical protein